MHYPSGTFVRHHREMDEIGTRTCALKFFKCIAGTEINLRMLLCRSGFSRDVGAGLVPAFFVCVAMIAPEGAPTGEILNTLDEILNTLDYYIMQSERGENSIVSGTKFTSFII